MVSRICIFALALVASAGTVAAQQQPPMPPGAPMGAVPLPPTPMVERDLTWSNALKFQPLALFGQGLELAYEHLSPSMLNGYHISLGVFLAMSTLA